MGRQDEQPPAGQSTDRDVIRQQRIAAMRELAGADVPAVGVSFGVSTARCPRVRARRVSVALSVLVVIVLLVSVGAAWQGWLPWQRK